MWITILFILAIIILLAAEYPVYRAVNTLSPRWPWLALGGALLLLVLLNSALLYRSITSQALGAAELLTGLVGLISAALLALGVFLTVEHFMKLNRQQEQLQKENDFHRPVVKNTPFPWVLKDLQTSYLAANPAYQALLGVDGEALVGKNDSDFFPPSQAAALMQADELALQQGSVQVQEMEITGASGKQWLQITRTPILDGDGAVSSLLATYQDITERKRLEMTLEEKKLALEATLDEKEQALNTAEMEKERVVDSLAYLIRFERLLASIGAYFIDIDPAKIDQGILYALRSIGRHTGVERCHILQYSGSGTELVPTYEWNIEGAGPRWENPGELDASGPPWTSFGQMEVIHVSNAAGLPAESNPVEEFMESIGIRSFTAVPLISGRSVAGYLWLESIRKELHWDAEFLDLLKIAGQIFVHAMSRKHKAEDLAEAQEKARSRLTTLEQQNRESDLLRDLGDLLQVCRTMDEAYQIIPRFAQSLIPVGSGALYLTRDLDEPADKAAAWGEAPPLEPELLINECWALRRGRPHLVADPKSGLNCGHLKPPLPASYLCSPLTAQGETIGLLHLRWVGEAPGADVLAYYHDLAKKIAEHIALALSNLSLRDKLRSQAIRDPLTGLFNRRYMEETLDREIRRAARHGTPVGVIMFDVDHLKNINDAYGHDAGDVALQTLGNLLLKSFRGEDVPCRYGGDEFTIILPECSVSEVFRRAEQFREAFRKQEYEHEGKRFGPLTLSIGIAAYPDHGSTVERLMQVSDAASYAAKAQGRDRVMIGGAIEE